MNCDDIVTKGKLAWQPHRQASDLDAFHVHDFPLIGTFKIVDQPILFTCLTGATSRSSIWAYLATTQADLDELLTNDFESTQDLELAVLDLFVGHKAVIASVDDGKINSWGSEDVGDEGVLEAAVNWMNLLLEQMAHDEQGRRAHRHEAEQARADATLQVLQPA